MAKLIPSWGRSLTFSRKGLGRAMCDSHRPDVIQVAEGGTGPRCVFKAQDSRGRRSWGPDAAGPSAVVISSGPR